MNQISENSSIINELVQKVSWLPLPSDDIRDNVVYYGRVRNNYNRWIVDGKLADTFDEINEMAIQRGQAMYDSGQFSEAMKDHNFTKNFVDWEYALANLSGYTDKKCERPSARWLRSYRAARRLLKRIFERMGKLTPYTINSVQECIEVFGDKTSSVCFGGRGSKAENSEYIFAALKVLEELIVNRSSLPADEWVWNYYVVFHRSQISHYIEDGLYNPFYLKKNRLVLGGPPEGTALAGKYAKPLYEAFSKHWWNYSGGDSPDAMRKKMWQANQWDGFWFQTDYSKFDQSVPAWLISDCFDIIKDLFPEGCRNEINWIANDFIHSVVLLPGYGTFQKHRGIPSGNYFTQIIGSMCNALMLLTYLCSLTDGSVERKMDMTRSMLEVGVDSPMLFMVMGDDCICFLRERISITDMSKYLWKVFGMTLSPDKTVTSDQSRFPTYLKRKWTMEGEWRDPLELVVALTHPEYPRYYNGFGTWHIIYGLVLTYRASFPHWLSERYVFQRMKAENGGLDALRKLETQGLPGPLRGFGNKDKARQWLFQKALLNDVSS